MDGCPRVRPNDVAAEVEPRRLWTPWPEQRWKRSRTNPGHSRNRVSAMKLALPFAAVLATKNDAEVDVSVDTTGNVTQTSR